MAVLKGMNNDHLNRFHSTQPDIQKSIAEGKKVFGKYCISCHQADGGGVPYLNPPLIKTSYVLGNKDSLIHIILHGLNQNIEIEDEVFTNPMPALNILKDEEIADVLTYVRNSFGNKASAVTPAEVKSVRSKTK
jgi:mono/diheme cytochrome c family protein